MEKRIQELFDTVLLFYRSGEIERSAFLRLTGDLLALKRFFHDSNVDSALILYGTLKEVLKE